MSVSPYKDPVTKQEKNRTRLQHSVCHSHVAAITYHFAGQDGARPRLHCQFFLRLVIPLDARDAGVEADLVLQSLNVSRLFLPRRVYLCGSGVRDAAPMLRVGLDRRQARVGGVDLAANPLRLALERLGLLR